MDVVAVTSQGEGALKGALSKGLLFFASALFLVCMACLSGCSQAQDGSSSSTTHGADGEVKQITDAYGREVEVPATVESAATVGSGARFVAYVGAVDKLVAVTEKESEPSLAMPYTMAFANAFKTLPTTSNGNHLMETNVNVEELISLNPDVIISSRSAAECDKLQEDTGIPVIGISYQDQLFTENVYASLECVAEALGTEDHAQELISFLQECANDLVARTSEITPEDQATVYFGGINYKGAKGWGGTYGVYPPAELLNVNNVASETGFMGSVDVDLEQLAQWNPSFIFLNLGNYDLLKSQYDENKALFDGLAAFQSGALYTQPSFNFNGTNIATGVCEAYFIGATVYPDLFIDVDLPSKYAQIYETMLDGYDFYNDLVNQGAGFGPFPSLA